MPNFIGVSLSNIIVMMWISFLVHGQSDKFVYRGRSLGKEMKKGQLQWCCQERDAFNAMIMTGIKEQKNDTDDRRIHTYIHTYIHT